MKSRRLKVVFLSYDFGEYCIRLASALAAKAEVCLWLARQLAIPHLSKLSPSVNFHPFQKPRLRQPLQQLQTLYSSLRHINKFSPDVIHLQQGHLWFNLALPLLRHYPLILTIHDPRQHAGDKGGQKTPQKILDFGFRRADKLIVHGEQLKKVIIEELRIPGERIHVMPMVAQGDASLHSQVRAEDNLILFFGRIWGYKGLEYLIRAEPYITAQVPSTRIIIAGEGDDFNRYRQMMVHPERFIVYNEYVSVEKRAELFRRASVVALPYTEASQSGVIPVAYTFSKPVVATTVGGLPEMVDHGRSGYLVPPRDERALAEAIVHLLKDKTLRREMGAHGKRKLDSTCSPDLVAEQTLAVYHQAL